MEENNKTNHVEGSVSDAVFGTSSDAIIEGLHQGILTAQSFSDAPEGDNPGDKNQIVNQQDQQDITNAMEEDEYTTPATGPVAQQAPDSSPVMSKEEAASILSEDEHLDEIGDSEKAVSAKNSEKDKIN